MGDNYQRSNNHNNNRGGRSYNDRKIHNNGDSLEVTTRNYANNRGGRGRGRFNNGGGRFQNNGRGGRGDGVKKMSGSMIPKVEIAMPTQVKLAMKVLTTLGNYSEMSEEDDVNANIKALANIFLTVGDLKEYPQEISDIFVKCLSTLSLQAPIISTLLALIHVKDQEFTNVVVNKLQTRFLQSLNEDDVITSRIVLKTLGCLASCHAFSIYDLSGDSLYYILDELRKVVVNSVKKSGGNASALTNEAQVAMYLLTSTIPWCVTIFASTPAGVDFLKSISSLAESLIGVYRSPFAVGGIQAVFHTDAAEAEGASILAGPGGVFDSLWEAMHIAKEVIHTQLNTAEGFIPPAAMITPWSNAEIDLDLAPLKDPINRKAPLLSFNEEFTASLEDTLKKLKKLGSRATACLPVGTNTTTTIGSAAATTWLKARIPIYDDQTSPEAGQCASTLSVVEKYLVVNYFQDIVYAFDPIICEDGTRVGSIDLMTTHLLGVFKLFPAEAHIEYILLEHLFGNLLQQPLNTVQNAALYKLILTLCKKTEGTPCSFPPAVALIVNILYQMLCDFDVNAVLEFGNWFAFHFINTRLSWPYWEFWSEELIASMSAEGADGMDDGETAAAAVDNTIEGAESTAMTAGGNTSMLKLFAAHFVSKLSKAVVYDKYKEVLPESFLALLPTTVKATRGHVIMPKCILYPSPAITAVLSLPGPEGQEANEMDAVVSEAVAAMGVEEVVSLEDTIYAPIAPIRDLATTLRELLEEKVSPEDLVEWFEKIIEENPSESSAWSATMLLQAIIHYGSANNTLSGVTGLLDRYSEVIRTLASTEEDQKALISTLSDVYGVDSAMFAYLLDEMMRRSQISPVAAVHMGPLLVDSAVSSPALYAVLEKVVDRSVDFVKAAISQRNQYGGSMPLDLSLDLTPSPEPEMTNADAAMTTDASSATPAAPAAATTAGAGASTAMDSGDADASATQPMATDAGAGADASAVGDKRSAATTSDDVDAEVDYDEEEEDDDDDNRESGRRQRFRRGEKDDEDQLGGKGLEVSAPIDEVEEVEAPPQDMVWLTTEAVKSSITTTRTVHATLLTAMVEAIRRSVDAGESGAVHTAVAMSFVRRLFRTMHGAERFLTATYAQPVVLAAVDQATLEAVPGIRLLWEQVNKADK